MASERIQRRIDRFLDGADEAVGTRDWIAVRDAALLGDTDKVRTSYHQALEACAKIGFRPEIALTHLQLAELLLEHYPDERPEAMDHLDFAIGEFRDMKMQPSLERALRRREILRA